MERKLKWFEFFAGGGMARLGLGPAWDCQFANDLCEKKASAYRARFGEAPELKVCDVAALSAADLPGTPDLVWASFPCQDLSLAGNQAGLKGGRSGTFHPFWKLVRALNAEGRKPGVIVLENVVGTLSSHGGRDFQTIVAAVADEGYQVGALVVDAVKFVPQSRPRLFIVAASHGKEVSATLATQQSSPLWHPPSLMTAYDRLTASLKQDWVFWYLPAPPPRRKKLSDVIEDEPTGVEWHSPETTRKLLSMMSPLNLKKVKAAQASKVRIVGTLYRRTRPLHGEPGQKTQRAEVRFDDISGCLRTPAGGSSRQIILVVEGARVRSRLLSPREAARLMGVDDSYPLPPNYNDAYHVFGDGLVVPVISWLENHLIRPLATLQTTSRAKVA
jgi:DNA (cytosine-5)-methyltransferase 1